MIEYYENEVTVQFHYPIIRVIILWKTEFFIDAYEMI